MAATPLELADLLSNDVKIVDTTAKRMEKGLYYLVFPGEWMPDGKEFVGQVPERLDPSILREWCETVRREANARINRKEAEAASRRNVGGGVDEQRSPAPAEPRGGVVENQAGGEVGKETLEETLRRKVTEAEIERDIRQQVFNQANEQLLRAKEQLVLADAELTKTRDVLTFLTGGSKDIAPKDSGKNSVEPSSGKAEGRPKGSK
jgi:hypothetical protein